MLLKLSSRSDIVKKITKACHNVVILHLYFDKSCKLFFYSNQLNQILAYMPCLLQSILLEFLVLSCHIPPRLFMPFHALLWPFFLEPSFFLIWINWVRVNQVLLLQFYCVESYFFRVILSSTLFNTFFNSIRKPIYLIYLSVYLKFTLILTRWLPCSYSYSFLHKFLLL